MLTFFQTWLLLFSWVYNWGTKGSPLLPTESLVNNSPGSKLDHHRLSDPKCRCLVKQPAKQFYNIAVCSTTTVCFRKNRQWERDWGQDQKLLEDSSLFEAAAGVWGCTNPILRLPKSQHFWKTVGWVLSSKIRTAHTTCFPSASLYLSFESHQVLILFPDLSCYALLPTQILPGNHAASE